MNAHFERNPAVEQVSLDEREVLFQSHTNQFVLLNETSRCVWDQLAAPRTAQEVARTVCERFSDVEYDVAHQDVNEALEQLVSLQFAVVKDSPANEQARTESQ